MLTLEQIKAEADALSGKLIATRRDFHMHPELAFEEVRTAGIVAERMQELGYEVQTGVGKTGVVGVMDGGKPGGEVLLLRFDMDALPVDEQVDVAFKSLTPGKMHACGHDAHTSIGLAVAELLARHRDAWSGIAKFVFQPAEEVVGGAAAMIKDGALENPKPTRTLSMHVNSLKPTGTIMMTDGPFMAAADAFDVWVRGKGTHGASPHNGIDPIVASAHIITALQTIVSRNVDPLERAVVTIGAIHGGTASNIIPDRVEMQGTLRTFTPAVRDLAMKRMSEIVSGVALSLGCEAGLSFREFRVPATVNEPKSSAIVREIARAMVGSDKLDSEYRTMGAEDCSWFLEAAPGAYVNIGAGSPDEAANWPHHSPRFTIDEAAMPIAAALLTKSAVDMLQ